MKHYQPAPRLYVCGFMAALCDVTGQDVGRAKYLAEMIDIVFGMVQA